MSLDFSVLLDTNGKTCIYILLYINMYYYITMEQENFKNAIKNINQTVLTKILFLGAPG